MRRILTFLNWKIDEDVLKCAVSDEMRQGVFKRNKRKQTVDEERRFTRKMLINLERKWRRVTKLLNARR